MHDRTRPLVTVVIPYCNTPDRLASSLDSVAKECVECTCEVIVVDNGSTIGCLPRATQRGGVKILRNATNLGFATACNQGAAAAEGSFLFFLNSDAELLGGCLPALLAALDADAGLAATAALETWPEGGVVSPGRRFLGAFDQALGLSGIPWLRHARDPMTPPTSGVAEAPWVKAAALLIRASAFHAVGGFDEGFFFYEEDEDFCWRLRRRGWRVGVSSDAVVRHAGGGSATSAGDWPLLSLYAGQLRFVRRRMGMAASLAYRISVAAVASCKALARPIDAAASTRRSTLRPLLRLLWLPGAKVSTTGA